MTTIPFKDATPVLQVKNLNVTFAGSPVSVLDGISLTVRAGETLALVGESVQRPPRRQQKLSITRNIIKPLNRLQSKKPRPLKSTTKKRPNRL